MNCTCKEPKPFSEVNHNCRECGKPISTPTSGYLDSRTPEQREADSKIEVVTTVSTPTEGWQLRLAELLLKADVAVNYHELEKALFEFVTQEKQRSYAEGRKSALDEINRAVKNSP